MLIDAAENTVRVLGGGIAGLNCAVQLHRRSIAFRLAEAADGLGGRMRTDLVDGFLCGDYCASASLQGALLSGRMAAEQIALGKTV